MENHVIQCVKSLQAPKLKTTALIKVMRAGIRSYDEQAFDNMSEESEKKHFERFIVNKLLWPVTT